MHCEALFHTSVCLLQLCGSHEWVEEDDTPALHATLLEPFLAAALWQSLQEPS